MKTELHVLKLNGKTFTCVIIEHPDRIQFAEGYDEADCVGDELRIMCEWLDAVRKPYENDPRPIEDWFATNDF
jgi:hypothetical protein